MKSIGDLIKLVSFCVFVRRYALTALKHCVRPNDLPEKSVSLIIRRVWPHLMEEATRGEEEDSEGAEIGAQTGV